MSNTPHNIRPGMTGDMGVTPQPTEVPRPDPAVEEERLPDPDGEDHERPDQPEIDPMKLELDQGQNLTNPQDDKKD